MPPKRLFGQFQDHRILIHFILDGDDLTASTGSIINLLSELMHYGKDELIFAVVGSDASQILPSLLPLMLHSLRTVFKFMLPPPSLIDRLNSGIKSRHNFFVWACFLFQKIGRDSVNHAGSGDMKILVKFPGTSILKIFTNF